MVKVGSDEAIGRGTGLQPVFECAMQAETRVRNPCHEKAFI